MTRGEYIYSRNYVEQAITNLQISGFERELPQTVLEIFNDDGLDSFSWRNSREGFDRWFVRDHNLYLTAL